MHRPDPVTVIRPREASRARLTIRGSRRQGDASGWRDSLRRRMLALADVAAVLTAIGLVAFLTTTDLQQALWAALVLPIWPILAKLYGLYDRDHTALRHLTVDELPMICLWALTGTAATALLLIYAPAGALGVTDAVLLWVLAAGSAFTFRAIARFAWRRLTPSACAPRRGCPCAACPRYPGNERLLQWRRAAR